MRKVMIVILVCFLSFSLFGCSGDSSDYNNMELNSKELKLVSSPSIEYIMTTLLMTNSVLDVEEDVEPGEECLGRIYFLSSYVDQSKFDEEESVAEIGTTGGGSIDIFSTVEDAEERLEYLQKFESTLLRNEFHEVVGTIVIRISGKMEKEKQIELFENIVELATSGEISEEKIADYSSIINKYIQINYDYEDLHYKQANKVRDILLDMGFVNIQTNTVEMDYSNSKESDSCVRTVSINGKSDFNTGDKFEKNSEIIITKCEDKRISTSVSAKDCEGKDYKDVVKYFEDAGFKNIQTNFKEIEYTDKVKTGSVVIVSINDVVNFENGALFFKDDLVKVSYRVVKPKSEKQNVSSNSNTSNNQNTTNHKDKVNVPSKNEQTEKGVWVPINGGTKYHSNQFCSKMKSPVKIPLETAKSYGYTACGRCH